MQELLRLQAEYAKQSVSLQKQDRLLQIAQVYSEQQIKKDEDASIKSLSHLEKTLAKSVEVQKGLRKDVQDLSKTLKEDSSGKDLQRAEKGKETNEKLVMSLESLEKAIKANINKFVKDGGGEAMGNKVAKDLGSDDNALNPNNKLTMRKVLFGNQTKREINQDSFFGLSKKLNTAVEKREFRAAAKESDRGTIATGNLPNNDTRNAFQKTFGLGKTLQDKRADRLFDEKRAAEEKLAAEQMRINRAKEAGLEPLKKQTAARDEAAADVIEKTPALKATFAPKDVKVVRKEPEKKVTKKAKVEKAEAVPEFKETASNVIPFPKAKVSPAHTEKSEDQAEADVAKAAADKSLFSAQHDMGGTLIASLEVQKQMLESLKKMVENGGTGGGEKEGGSLLDSATDLLGSKGGKGKMLGKAAGFLGKHAGKIGAIGGVAMGAYDAYSGWNEASDAEARGEISKNEADVKKGGAVGKGVGGAAGAWGGAAAGAAIGSVVPVVGTAIGGVVGGALGYMGGSAVGEKVGGALTSGYKSIKGMLGFGNPEDDKKKKDSAALESYEIAGEKANPGQPLSEKQMAVIGLAKQTGNTYPDFIEQQYAKQKKAAMGAEQKSEPTVSTGSKNNADLKAANSGVPSTNLVNAPTNNVINNSNSNTPSRSPTRNQESTVSRYIDNRYA